MENETQIIDQSEEEVLDYTYSITSYGADYPVDSLVKRLNNKNIKIPKFQRGFVWNEKQASRFIESLLLGLPVPGVFLSKDTESADLLVIDGQQRLKSLQFFYKGIFGDHVFKLYDVQERFVDRTYSTLDPEDRQRLDDSIIHATIVKQDEPSEDNSSIFLIFERLNTGGMQLQPQEIRSAIYPGEFSELIHKLNDYPRWRTIFGSTSKRMKDQEFILRFFAMFLYRDNYVKPLKGFLNSYMAKNRHLELHNEDILTQLFHSTVNYVDDTLGNEAFRPRRVINASVFDSIMVGVATMLERQAEKPSKEVFTTAYNELLQNKEYLSATTDGTSDEIVVDKRMTLSIEKFSTL